MTDLRLHRRQPQCQLLERIVNREKGDLNSCLFVGIPGYPMVFFFSALPKSTRVLATKKIL